MIEIIQQFEEKIKKALEFKYQNVDQKIRNYLIQDNILTQWELVKFYNLYIKSEVYPKERIKEIMYYLFDIKQQLYYLLEVDLGLYNHLIYNRGFSNNNIIDFPHIQLTKFSLDQNIILKSRILWERIMNFIYYLETGKKLENKVSGKKSKKKIFFDFVSETKWNFLVEYKNHIDWFDDKLRTPEVHKSSIFRNYFLTASDINPDDPISLIGIVVNPIWENGVNIIQGRNPPLRYWSVNLKGIKNLKHGLPK